MTRSLPFNRLAGFYFFRFAALGALMPYFSLYLKDIGFTAVQIGAVFAVLLGSKIVAPYVWGWAADRYGHRLTLIQAATAAAAVLFLCVPFVHQFLALALLVAGYGFFANAALPQFEALTFSHLGGDDHRYGRIRLWGSVGFIVSVLALGGLLAITASHVVPVWIVLVLTCLLAVSLIVPDAPTPFGLGRDRGQGAGFWSVLRQPHVISLLAVCFLSRLSHGPYMSFFSIYMEHYGYSRSVIGVLWALGVTAEVALFALLPRLISAFGLRRLMLAAMALTTLRWSLLAGFPNILAIVGPTQVLHMATFGLYHGVAINLINRLFRGRLQGRGQAVYSSLSFGAGGALGALASGYIWATASPPTLFWTAAAAAALAFAIAWIGLREPANPPAFGNQSAAVGHGRGHQER